MEEEKAAAYYDELTRKGEGAARFKQGLGFSSASNDAAPSRGSALSSSSSFLSTFVKASSPSKAAEFQKEAQLATIQNKLKKTTNGVQSQSQSSSRVSRDRDRDEIHSSRGSGSRDRNSRHRSRSRSRDSSRRSRRRSRSRDRDKHSRRRSRSRSTSRGRSGDDYRRRRGHRSRSREKDTERRRRSRSESPQHRRSNKSTARNGSKFEKQSSSKVDYAKLIEGYDKMTPAERVKAKMKLQISETVEKDEANMGSGWERFDFNKDAPLNDEEIEAAEDDAVLVKHMGQSFRFSAVEKRWKCCSAPRNKAQLTLLCNDSLLQGRRDYYLWQQGFAGNENPSPNIIIPQEWADAAEAIAYDSVTCPPPITFVCGPKNSGKTTFSRHLLNVLLQRYKRVAYLDTDVGQTEFTPPGLLSLTVIDKITPDLTIPCVKTPERCFFFGDISSKRDPTTYLTSIHALYDHYRKEHCVLNNKEIPGNAGLPLVVNTPGWVKGIGYDILVDMLKYISPSYVVKICISAEKKNLPVGAFWLDDGEYCATTVIEINSARQDSFNRSVLIQKDARLLRDLHMMAYFRQCFPSDMSITAIKELARALAAHPPLEVSIASIKIKHLHCQVPKTEIFYSLNASVVGLAVTSEGSESFPHCVGLGIVRGIDTLKGILYVITPVPQNLLEKVDLLLQGYIQIPSCLLQVQGCISPYMSANVLPTDY